jgi:hypothetical protein
MGSNHLCPSSMSEVSEDQSGDNRVVERPDHGQELREQVDRGREPGGTDQEPDLRASRDARILHEVLEEQQEVWDESRELLGRHALSRNHQPEDEYRVEDEGDSQSNQQRVHGLSVDGRRLSLVEEVPAGR